MVLEVIYQRRIMYIMYSLVVWCGESLCVLYLEFVCCFVYCVVVFDV